MQRKGINYDVGIEMSYHVTRPTFDMGVVHRELEIIKNDLHCNAIRIVGTDIDRLIAATEDALKQGLEVWLSPWRPEKSAQETLDYIVRCAEAAEGLRQQFPALVFILGSELTLF
ncbi:MAG: abortive infection protein, partial [Ktedonobacteraceae bacterium]|nr:abortive infection protein [Ktedonobacteraceae bacterium]